MVAGLSDRWKGASGWLFFAFTMATISFGAPAAAGQQPAQQTDQLEQQVQQLKQQYEATTHDLEQRIAALEQQIQTQKEENAKAVETEKEKQKEEIHPPHHSNGNGVKHLPLDLPIELPLIKPPEVEEKVLEAERHHLNGK